MKKDITMWFIAMFPACFFAQGFQNLDKESIMSAIGKQDLNAPNLINAILPEGRISGTDNGFQFSIYQSAENIRYDGKPTKSASGSSLYYSVLPSFKISAVKAVVTAPSEAYVSITLTPIIPNLSAIKRHLERENPYANLSKVRPVAAMALVVNYPRAKEYSNSCSGGCSLYNPLTIRLKFTNPYEAKQAAIAITNDPSELSFNAFLNFKTSTRDYFRISRGDIVNSQAYRDYISPVIGEKISLLHLQLAKAQMERELNVLVKQESVGENAFFMKALNDAWSQLVDPKVTVIPFENISKGGAISMLTNFSEDKRYATDVIRKIAVDATNLTDLQWEKKYRSEFDRDVDKSHILETSGSARATILDIFGGRASGSYKTNNKYKEGLKKLLDTKNGGREIFHTTFHYEMVGEKYVPKGIKAQEVIGLSSNGKQDSDFTYYKYDNQLRPVGISIVK